MSRSETYYKDGAMIVRGPRVTDPTILAAMKLGPDEDAILMDPNILRRAVQNLDNMEQTGKAPGPDKTEVS